MNSTRNAARLLAVVFSVLLVTSAAGGGALSVIGTAQAQEASDVLYRVNAGGDAVESPSGPDWSGTGDQYVTGGSAYGDYSGTVSLDGSVPAGTPTEIFGTEVYGDQQWTFSENVQSDQQYEVRLYFAEVYHGVSNDNGAGARVFDVAIEDETALSAYDIFEEVGAETGVMKSFTVTPSDGSIDVNFTTIEDNAKVSAIEIVESEPEPNALGGPSNVDFGTVLTGESATETVTVTNLGDDGDPAIDVSGVSVTGADADAFSVGSASQTTLAPGESADLPVTFSPADAQAKQATLEVAHTGDDSPLAIDLAGEGASSANPAFSKSTLQGFSAGSPTAVDFGPDGRAYVSTQGGTVYALNVTRTGENSYAVENEVEIGAIEAIPNHDDAGDYTPGETDRQITGLTAAGTADQPVVYVSSSDPSIDVGQDDDDTDTNSGAISRLTLTPGSDGVLQTGEIDHDVLVMGLPRSEENHATNGLDLSADGETLYVAQGGHTNKGAPGDNFGHTPEYALSAAILEIDLAQIEAEYQAKNLQSYDPQGASQSYPDLEFYYAVPTIQNDDATDGDDLPFGGNDGINQAKLVEGSPVQIYSPGYRNPYDLVVTQTGQVYAADHGPNGGWGGQPADADGAVTADAASVTNHPNEAGSFSTSDQLAKVDEGDYGGHAAPIRANPTGADIYDADGEMVFDITESNSPVAPSQVNPVEADYIPPTGGSPDPGAPAGTANTMEFEDGQHVLFGPTGGLDEYTASNFGGAMAGDLLQVELSGDVERVELSADGETVVNVETIFNTGGPLGIDAVGDDGPFPGTVWTANHGGNDVTVFEPVDYGDTGGGDGEQCTGADDATLDEDGDGYDNADEIDAGSDPCSAASTPADFDGDGTSNLNDPDDDGDGLDDTEDPFALDPANGLETTPPVQHDLSELSLFGENGQGWTGLMTNGSDYRERYDPTQMTVGGAAEVLTVEGVPAGDAYADTNTQQYGFQFGVDPPAEPFVVETTVASFPENPEDFQSAGVFVGTGDQSNYVKLVAAANGGDGGVEFAQEVGDEFEGEMTDESAVTGNDVTLGLTVDPTTDPAPDNDIDEVAVTAEYEVDGTTAEVGTAAMPANWLDTADGVAPAVGVVSTSNGASSTFDATWTDISVEYVTPPNEAPGAAFTYSPSQPTATEQVAFDASGSSDADGSIASYEWDFDGDGETDATGQSVTHAFDAAGEYDATLTVTDDEGATNATIKTVAVAEPETETLAEAVASYGEDDDSTISLAEIQTAINWWSTGAEVPNTGGETFSLEEIQQLINLWSTGATVGDGSDGGSEQTGSALVEITPDSGVETSTYGGDTYQVTNTGEKNITSVSFDLSSSSLPDMVFDPQGTAGDPTGEGLNVASDGGTGIVTEPGTGEAFAAPHNGQNADDGYDVMTVEFDDFEPGEQATFWADNDPTTIKGATIASQEAGPVSGLELARSTVTVTYADGTTQTTQLMGDGSAGGATAVVNATEAPAPTVDVAGVSLDDAALEDYHSAATVSEASQTVAVSGQPGETVTLVRVEAELALSNVPDADGDGEPGYDVEPYEANNAQNVAYYTATIGSDGTATIPVTLTNTTGDGDDAGYNYFVAAHGEAAGDMGLASDVVVLKYDQNAGDGGDAGGGGDTVFALNAGGSAYTAADGTVYQADTNFDGGTAYDTTEQIGDTQDDPLYQTERYGNFTYDVPLEDGEYEVTLQFAEIFQGVAASDSPDSTGPTDGTNENDRVFDASIEGEEVLSNYDIFAEVGPLNATEETFTATVSDGELSVEFSTVYDNAKVSAIEVAEVDDGSATNAAPTIDSIADQTLTVGDSTTVPVSADDADGDDVSVSVTGPDFLTLANGELTVAPQSGDAGTYTVDVTAADGNGGTATETFQVTVEQAAGGDASSADFAVNTGGAIDASTYGAGSFEITNTGDGQIASVTYDLSSAAFPDVVFDPEGTAGDSGAKGFTPDGGASAVDPSGSFAAPHNGQNGEDGYDKLAIDFDDFEGGETFAFSADVDPTSIKNADGTGAAGSVSGLELSGATVTVEYADGATQTTHLFGDASAGGSQATSKADAAGAPTIGVEAVSLDSSALDDYHSAATVSEPTQTVTVSGPAGGTVELLRIEGQLELANQADGYDLEAYEANTAESVAYQTVELDADGQAAVEVSLTNTSSSGVEGGFNYLLAAVEDGGDTGQPSNVAVLKYDQNAGADDPDTAGPQALHRVNAGESATISATDDGPNWTGVANASSQYLASVAEEDGGTYCGGDALTPDDTVPESTPDGVWNCERYGDMSWEFPVDPGQDVEVRLSLANSYPGASAQGDRQFNVSIEGSQVLTQYDPVADVGHATATTKSVTVTDDGDGTIAVDFEQGAAENPEVRAIEILTVEDGTDGGS
ncbi:malectin domain-containing carbohydrate-binding protein [Halorussus marinus]|uniref:malectin domain-containing carbohydrate-binding protein n=1 Tax=Halorussus marinus TaxID=2505976 RepID=UPI00143CF6AE|nr:malectin domain-containing carbohydrate-binding protein [Halorussus marinus]